MYRCFLLLSLFPIPVFPPLLLSSVLSNPPSLPLSLRVLAASPHRSIPVRLSSHLSSLPIASSFRSVFFVIYLTFSVLSGPRLSLPSLSRSLPISLTLTNIPWLINYCVFSNLCFVFNRVFLLHEEDDKRNSVLWQS